MKSTKKLKLQYCDLAQQHYCQSARQFAHVFHRPNTICITPEFDDLPEIYRAGIVLHELGHLTYEPTEKHSEDDADFMGFLFSGVKISRRTYRGAKRLQCVALKDLKEALGFIKSRVRLAQ